MDDLTMDELLTLEKKCEQFDYIRFTMADINGNARGKVVPSKSVPNFIREGRMYVGQ